MVSPAVVEKPIATLPPNDLFFCKWQGREINVWDACVNDIREGLTSVTIKDSSLSVTC